MGQRDRFFSIEHIRASSFHASPELTEQALHCLELVVELSESRLEFQFKGGNSLLVILDKPQRFSIDVDIATDCTAEWIEKVLDLIVGRYGIFTRWEKRQHKTKPWIALASYYLFYQSAVKGSPQECSIMLDAQLNRSPYSCELRPVVCGELYQSDTLVEFPLPASIIGDKLLTLGPGTLGIPVGKGKAAQRLKHVFDVSRLCEMRPSLEDIRESFMKCLAFENGLQQRTVTSDEVVLDTLASCFSVSRLRKPPCDAQDGTVLAEHVAGLEPVASHLFAAGYSWSDLQHDMARAACCIAAAGFGSVTHEQFKEAFFGDDSCTTVEERVDRYWKLIASWGSLDLEGLSV